MVFSTSPIWMGPQEYNVRAIIACSAYCTIRQLLTEYLQTELS